MNRQSQWYDRRDCRYAHQLMRSSSLNFAKGFSKISLKGFRMNVGLGYLEWRELHAERPVRTVFRRKLEITMILCDDLICLKSTRPLHLRQIVQPKIQNSYQFFFPRIPFTWRLQSLNETVIFYIYKRITQAIILLLVCLLFLFLLICSKILVWLEKFLYI